MDVGVCGERAPLHEISASGWPSAKHLTSGYLSFPFLTLI